MQSQLPLDSTHTCQQTIRAGILQRTDCSETHEFRLGDSDVSTAMTTVRQSLVLQGPSSERFRASRGQKLEHS